MRRVVNSNMFFLPLAQLHITWLSFCKKAFHFIGRILIQPKTTYCQTKAALDQNTSHGQEGTAIVGLLIISPTITIRELDNKI